jgi:transposase
VAVASAVEITLSQEERSELERRAGKLTLPYRDVQRAKAVLYAAEGMSNGKIAGRLEMCSKLVGQWRRRIGEQRLEGLHDQPRSGRPRRFPPARGRAAQGDRLRAAQRPTASRYRASADLNFIASSSSRRSVRRRRRRSVAG